MFLKNIGYALVLVFTGNIIMASQQNVEIGKKAEHKKLMWASGLFIIGSVLSGKIFIDYKNTHDQWFAHNLSPQEKIGDRHYHVIGKKRFSSNSFIDKNIYVPSNSSQSVQELFNHPDFVYLATQHPDHIFGIREVNCGGRSKK